MHGGGGKVAVSVSAVVVVVGVVDIEVVVAVVFGDGVDAMRTEWAVGHIRDDGLVSLAESEVAR